MASNSSLQVSAASNALRRSKGRRGRTSSPSRSRQCTDGPSDVLFSGLVVNRVQSVVAMVGRRWDAVNVDGKYIGTEFLLSDSKKMQVAEKNCLFKQYRMETKRLRKLDEEEEIKRLRRELVPKAQPMPYFNRPFLPKRSTKQPTIPRDPKFIQPHQKKMKPCLS